MSTEEATIHDHLLTASEAYHAGDHEIVREELMDALGQLAIDTDVGADQQTSRYVTVFHQLKNTDNCDEGDRFISHGRCTDDRYVIDDEHEDFQVVARPIAHIDTGVPMTEHDLGEWCNSYAGKRALAPYFPDMEPEDPTLPDADEYVEDGDSA